MVMIQEAVNWDVVSSLVVVSRKTHDVTANPVRKQATGECWAVVVSGAACIPGR